MDERAAVGIFLLVISLFGLVLFFPVYSPATYGGWGCPMLGRRGHWGVMGPGGWSYMGFPYSNLALIFLFDAAFIVVLLLGVYLIWKSTQRV